MNPTEQSPKTRSHRTDFSATLLAFLPFAGTSAPSSRRAPLALIAALALIAGLALTAVPASAALPTTLCTNGSISGRCDVPTGVAVDQTDGTVYVTDYNNRRVDVFDSAGHFLRAFGWGVLDGAAELQVCTTSCQAGEAGPGPGEIQPLSLAVDNSGGPSAHDLYVVDNQTPRVEKFTSAGVFLGAFGEGDLHTSRPALAVDSSGEVWVGDSERLLRFSPAGAFLSELSVPSVGSVVGLAIDTDSLSPSFEDLYALNQFVNEVQQITPPAAGSYEVCFEAACSAPLAAGASQQQITAALESLPTIGPGNARTFLSGTRVEFTGTLSGKNVPQLEISTGSVATKTQGIAARVLKLGPTGTVLETIDASGHPAALGLDPGTGNLFVADHQPSGPVSLLEFDPSGTLIEKFGTGSVIGSPQGGALAFGDGSQRLYVASADESVVQSFALPEPGPLPEEAGEEAAPVAKTTATLKASINPEGASTTYHFAYLAQATYEAQKSQAESEGKTPEEVAAAAFAGAQKTEPESAPIGEDFSYHPAAAAVTGLSPETAYRFRVVATNANGTVAGQGATFTTEPPVRIDATYATEVAAGSATLNAELNPLGDPGQYHFEYLTQAAFEANGGSFTGPEAPTSAPLPDAQLAAGNAEITVSEPIQGLAQNTAYRYRLLASDHCNPALPAEVCSVEGPDRTFTTQGAAASLLPDNRAYELVSPPNKHGSLIQPISKEGAVVQAAADGSAITYVSQGPLDAEPPANRSLEYSQSLSRRSPTGGWSTENITSPHEEISPAIPGRQSEYAFFSEDLSSGLLEPKGATPLSPQTTEKTPYRHEADGTFVPLLTEANVLPGAQFGGHEVEAGSGEWTGSPAFIAASPNGAAVILQSPQILTAGFKPGFKPKGGSNLYELSAGLLHLISVLPNGEPALEAGLTATFGSFESALRGAVSTDGSRVVFAAGTSLYLRANAANAPSASGACDEAGAACTIQLDAAEPGCATCQSGGGAFQGASADGSKVFFTDSRRLTADSTAQAEPDLYMCQIVEPQPGHLACALSDLTVDSNPGEAAGLPGGRYVPAISPTGDKVYFVASGVLTSTPNARGEHAIPGNCASSSCNLYEYDTTTGETALIAVLSSLDSPDWGTFFVNLTARTSPDGRYFTFMSRRSLTGYDNRDAKSGQPDQEVYLYDSATGDLHCVSCNPTGARPRGIFEIPTNQPGGIPGLLPDHKFTWQETWLAGMIPGWTSFNGADSLHQSRYLSDSGRMFFNSTDALVPQDTNGVMDVYQYEPVGVGTCTTATSTYSPTSGGCVDLISSGTSPQESAFLDASESGNDVFFLTGTRLTAKDEDAALDIYDARTGGGEPELVKPVECSGDACQQPAVPPNDATPGSLTFNGAGNLTECPRGKRLSKGKCVNQKAKKKHKHKKSSKKKGSGKKQKGKRTNANRGGAK